MYAQSTFSRGFALLVISQHLIAKGKLLACHCKWRFNHLDFLLDRLHCVEFVDFNAENANGRAEMEPHGYRRGSFEAGPASVVSWFCNDVLTVVDLEPAVEAGWQQAVQYLPARE